MGFVFGSAFVIALYAVKAFRWPGPGTFSSLGFWTLASVALAISLIPQLPAVNQANLRDDYLVAGGFFWVGAWLFLTLLIFRQPQFILNPAGNNRQFFVADEPGYRRGSVSQSVVIHSKKRKLMLFVRPVGTRFRTRKIELTEHTLRNDPTNQVASSSPTYTHILTSPKNGAFEVWNPRASQDKDFFVTREEVASGSSRQVGVVYPTYTWKAYNPSAAENLYTVPPGTWVDGAVPIAGNRRDIHTHHVTTNLLRELSRIAPKTICLTNQDIDVTQDWMRLPLVILTGHDEFWTDSMVSNVRNYLESGGKLAIFSGNVAYKVFEQDGTRIRHHGEWNESDTPEESFLGSSFRFGGYGVRGKSRSKDVEDIGLSRVDLKRSGGMCVADSSHPIFQRTGLKTGDWFGVESQVNRYEIDGVPLDSDLEIERVFASENSIERNLLAWSFAKQDGKLPHRCGTIVEFTLGKGSGIHLGSIGWGVAVNTDRTVAKIVRNVVKYLLSHPQPAE